VASELHERILNEGVESVPRADFLEEVCNDDGSSILVVSFEMFTENYDRFIFLQRTKDIYATVKIERFWRKFRAERSTKAIARKFCNEGVSGAAFMETSFDELASKVREEKVVCASGDMLLRVLDLVNSGRYTEPRITGVVDVKVFLAAYVVTAHPCHVFETMAEVETAVRDAAGLMLDCVHKTAAALMNGEAFAEVRKGVGEHLYKTLCDYLRTFKVSTTTFLVFVRCDY
jgi:hypothetical protein